MEPEIALGTGMLLGHLMRAEIDATPVLDGNNDYLPCVDIRIPLYDGIAPICAVVRVEVTGHSVISPFEMETS